MPASTSVDVGVGSESDSHAQTVPAGASSLILPEDIQRWIDGAGPSVVCLALFDFPILEAYNGGAARVEQRSVRQHRPVNGRDPASSASRPGGNGRRPSRNPAI
ncbi:hypothetical protein XA68_11221 [Ophiocordyceps unilateralis]|uniref:Uncharacterized protein n=1 Tax=Ophiocordyceps unilateralis TaxID=268505 RepID=A0A2A9PQ38_OPHUN|nr:hypothetical protein XA68_11221 [Ophiocordyceps unilateralis]